MWSKKIFLPDPWKHTPGSGKKIAMFMEGNPFSSLDFLVFLVGNVLGISWNFLICGGDSARWIPSFGGLFSRGEEEEEEEEEEKKTT